MTTFNNSQVKKNWEQYYFHTEKQPNFSGHLHLLQIPLLHHRYLMERREFVGTIGWSSLSSDSGNLEVPEIIYFMLSSLRFVIIEQKHLLSESSGEKRPQVFRIYS